MSNNQETRRRVFILSPHPDDVVFFMGGTFLKHLHADDEVQVLLFSHGEKGSIFSFNAEYARTLGERRLIEAKSSTRKFKNLRWITWDLPDGEFKKIADIEKKLNEVLVDFKPDLIYLPEAKTELTLFSHPDHLQCGLWGLQSAGQLPGVELRLYHSKQIDLRINVDAEWPENEYLLRAHSSQYAWSALPPLLLHFGGALRKSKAEKEGKILGCKYAEFFRVIPVARNP